MTVLELVGTLAATGWACERWQPGVQLEPFRCGQAKGWYLKGSSSRWYLAARAAADTLFVWGVECLKHVELTSYYKGLAATKAKGTSLPYAELEMECGGGGMGTTAVAVALGDAVGEPSALA